MKLNMQITNITLLFYIAQKKREKVHPDPWGSIHNFLLL
jgi:hypothetical protein